MPRQELKEALETLHRELESGVKISEDDRAALLEAIQEIEDALAEGGDAVVDSPLGERINASLRDFGRSYPRFAKVLERVSEALANLGI